jgi:predicted nuclease of predicted toxin-antitoxin system
LVNFLREEGHDVAYIQEFSPSITDKKVLEKAYLQQRFLVTEDKDFGELVFRLGLKARGIIL